MCNSLRSWLPVCASLLFALFIVCDAGAALADEPRRVQEIPSEDLVAAHRWFSWGRFYYLEDDYEKARECLEKALELNRFHASARALLAAINLEESPESFVTEDGFPPEPLRTTGPFYQWYINGIMRYRRGELELAEQAFARAREYDSSCESARAMLYRVRMELGHRIVDDEEDKSQDYEEVLQQLRSEGRLNSSDAWRWYQHALFLLEVLKEPDNARTSAMIALELDPDLSEAAELVDAFESGRIFEPVPETAPEPSKPEPVSETAPEPSEPEPVPETEPEPPVPVPVPETAPEPSEPEPVPEVAPETPEPEPGDAFFEEAREKVAAALARAEEHVEALSLDEADIELEQAFKTAFKAAPDDIRAPYKLFLICRKDGRYDESLRYFLKSLNLYHGYQYRKEKAYSDFEEHLDCFVRALVIQAAVNAYNLRYPERKMSRDTTGLNIPRLVNEGLLDAQMKREVILEIPAGKVTRSVHGLRCGQGGHSYQFDQLNNVSCQIHGTSPMLLEQVAIHED